MTTRPEVRDAQSRRFALAIELAVALIALATSAYLIFAWQSDTLDYEIYVHEWGVLEIVHSLLTGLSTWLFYRAWRDATGAVKTGAGALTMLAGAGFVRELDLKKTAEVTGPDWFYFLADHGLQEALMIAMTAPILFYLYRHRADLMELVGLTLRWRTWPLFAAALFIVAGIYFDERIVTSMRMRFWEELIETYGYLFMVLAAWRHWEIAVNERDPAVKR